MPNASRYLECGHTYHLTHRCHDRRFLLKFARDRDMYRRWLREGALRYRVAVYNYCITSNHVHVIKRKELKREVIWTESLAVGDRTFVDSVASGTENRRRFTYLPVAGSETAWSIHKFDAGYKV